MKRNSLILIALILVFGGVGLEAQVDTVWVQTYGTDGWDSAEEVQQTRDGGFIMCGVAGADAISNPDLFLIKTDSLGNETWRRQIGDAGSRTYGTSVRETGDGGFILTGHKEWDIYLAKTDSLGYTLWTRTFGNPGPADCGSSVRLTADGGYIVTGYTGSWARGGEGDYDAFLLKTDASGSPEWQRTYGLGYMEQGFSVEVTPDGGYFMCGYTYSPTKGNFADVYLVRTDSLGEIKWEDVIGGWNSDIGHAAQETSDGGFIVVGSTKSFGAGFQDVFMIRVDAYGDTLWTRTFGGPGEDVGYSVTVSSDNGEDVFTVAGKTNAYVGGKFDLYLIRLDDRGDLLWEWAAGADPLDEIGRCVIETRDGDLVIAGDTGSFSGEFFDIFLLKVRVLVGVEVSIRPTGRTVLSRGEVLEFRSTITNYTDHVVEGDYWLTARLPSGKNVLVPDNLLSLPGLTHGRLFPFGSNELDNDLWIYPAAETGTYHLFGRLGIYPDFVIEEDSFEFVVIE